MKFGFIAHASADYDLESFQFMEVGRSFEILPDFRAEKLDDTSCVDLIHIPKLTSKAGCTTEGRILYLPMTAEEMVEDQEKAFNAVYNAAKDLEKWGAGIIGLGGFTGIIGNRGLDLQEKLDVPITTGNSFTVYNSVYAAELLVKELGMDMKKQKVAIVGFPGSIGLAIARILAVKEVPIVLVGRREAKFFENIIRKIKDESPAAEIEFSSNVNEALKRCNIIFSATSSGEIIDPIEIPPWTIFLDIAVPGDVKYILPDNRNILYVYGGTFDFCEEVNYGGVYGKFFRNNFPGCIGETMLLALENMDKTFSIGRELDIEKIKLIGELGHKHGFEVITPYDGFTSLPVSEELISNFKNSIKKDTSILFNQGMRDIGSQSGFLKADGNTFTYQGKTCLDFYGSDGELLLGHHPRIKKVVQYAVENNMFFYTASGHDGAYDILSKKLISLAPGHMGKVFFAQSFDQVMKEAVRVSRQCTGKRKIAFTSNKTGLNEEEVRDICEVGYGNLEEIEKTLSLGDFAAFITEPLSTDGQLMVPPDGYLAKVKEICQRYSCLFIINEQRTALGRTGYMFALERENVLPDMVILGNSLGAGVFPLSCLITTKSILKKAGVDDYGAKSYYAGSPLNSIAGLAACELIDVLIEENLMEKSKEVGAYLLGQLQKIQSGNRLITEVSGQGLTVNIKLKAFSDEVSGEIFSDALSMVNQELAYLKLFSFSDFSQMMGRFYEEMSYHVLMIIKRLVDEKNSKMLLDEYNILCSSQNNSFMIMPPLNTTVSDVDVFVSAFEKFCAGMDLFTAWRKKNIG
ncbi:MAG: aminotransferase class III-fold pyridoxal phosphate-dependent enzyme [Clostridia bacterium]|nr:aminotransferase class III-fold pyridoxal phosphate-dependent enzyme [Clostridia bacterium]